MNVRELDEDNAVDVYLARQSVKRDLYSYCNTYYRTKTYNPDYTAVDMHIEQPFIWWILVVVLLNVVIVGGITFAVLKCFLPKRKKASAGSGSDAT